MAATVTEYVWKGSGACSRGHRPAQDQGYLRAGTCPNDGENASRWLAFEPLSEKICARRDDFPGPSRPQQAPAELVLRIVSKPVDGPALLRPENAPASAKSVAATVDLPGVNTYLASRVSRCMRAGVRTESG